MAYSPRWTLAIVLAVAAVTPAAFAQTACTFSLDHTTASYAANGGNDIVTIGALPGGCSTRRNVTANVPWITVSFGDGGTGPGTAGYSVAANSTLSPRAGTLTIAGILFTVTQASGTCSFSASGGNAATVNAAGGMGAFSFNASNSACPWTLGGGADWLTVTSAPAGTGSSGISFSAIANPVSASRVATFTIGSLNFTVTQNAACGTSLSPFSATVAAAGGTGNITITLSGTGCSWAATSNNPDFITVTGATSGASSGTTTYVVTPNTTGMDRVGSININSSGFSILQPSNCNYSIAPGNVSLPSSGGTGVFTVTSTCPWTVNLNGNDWLATFPVSGPAGTTTINYSAAPNTAVTGRTGSLTIGTQSFSVTEAAVPCSVTVNPTSYSFPNSGGTTGISVNAADGCAWASASQAKWLTTTNSAGNGSGQVSISADPNPDPKPRTGTITIANQVVAITEDAQQCDYQLSPPSATVGSSGGTGTITVATRCSWTAASNAPWLNVITSSGSGTSDIRYAISPLPSSDPRSATIAVGTATFTITQTASPCALTLGESDVTIDAGEGRKVLQVTGNSACRWRPSISSDSADWLSISSWSNVNGGGVVVYHFAPNFAASPRQGSIVITSAGVDPLTAALTQNGVMPELSAVVNAASNVAGPVAPGEIVMLRGVGLGPAVLVDLQLTDDGTTVLGLLAGVQVLFDGMPAPLLRVSNKEVQAVAPYGIDKQTTTQVTVVNQGIVSNAMTLDVAAANPAVFTVAPTGSGQIDARNAVDGSVNNASNAVGRNAVITFWVTGEGQTRPAGVDGLLNVAPGPMPVLPVTVQIGGLAAVVVSAAGSPGDVAGRLKIDARVAQQVAPGPAVPVLVRVGQASTQPGATIAVK